MKYNAYMARYPTPTVLERGQVTIPKELRKRLGINPGTVLEFRAEAGKLIASKRSEESRVERVYGSLRSGGSTDEVMRSLRGRR
jgi:antitoxin PrlF